MGRGYVVKNVEWRGYVVSKVGIELLGQLKNGEKAVRLTAWVAPPPSPEAVRKM